jgi:cbb3-type cytochrome oxidase maturation protein
VSVIFLLIAVSLVFASGFLIAFIWAMRDRQFEDDHTPAVRMLFDALPSKGKAEIGKLKLESGNRQAEKAGKGTLFCEKLKLTSPDPSSERIGISNLSGGELHGRVLSSLVPCPSSFNQQ